MTLHLPGMCNVPAASLLPGTHHLDPVQNISENQYSEPHTCGALTCLATRFNICSYVSYINSEIAWGTGDVSCWGQGPGNMLHAEGRRQDPQGQPDHQITLRAFEGPAVAWVYIRLERREVSK